MKKSVISKLVGIQGKRDLKNWEVVKYEIYICSVLIISIGSFFLWTFAKG